MVASDSVVFSGSSSDQFDWIGVSKQKMAKIPASMEALFISGTYS